MKYALCAAAFAAACHAALAEPAPPIQQKNLPQLLAMLKDAEQRTPAQRKMSSALLQTLDGAGTKPALAAAPAETHKRILIHGDITDALQAFLASEGATQVVAVPHYGVLSANLPVGNIVLIAGRPEVRSIGLAVPPTINDDLGLADGGGYAAHDIRNSTARNSIAGSNGEGNNIKVCVISDSVDHLADEQNRGWLGPVAVPPGQDNINPNPGTPGTSTYLPGHTGEGTAMLEIIHAVAPDARLEFATSDPDEAAALQNIATFIAQPNTPGYDRQYGGCSIIVDDIDFGTESPFQDGAPDSLSRAVMDASANNIPWFSSAGNIGNLQSSNSGTWEGDFNGSPPDPVSGFSAAQFGSGSYYDQINFASDSTTNTAEPQQAFLWWNDPPGHATNDYILIVEDASYAAISIADATIDGNEQPMQAALVPTNAKYIQILKRAGAADRFLHLQLTNGAKLSIATAGAIFGHQASTATFAFSVGAVSAYNRTTAFAPGAETVDSWSSDGPRQLFYTASGAAITPNDLTHTGGTLVQKPDFLAADCVNTGIYGPPTAFRPFCGTSAASAQAAGIAALLLSRAANPNVRYPAPARRLQPSDLRQILTSSAMPIGAPGWNKASGYGIAMPGLAFQKANPILGYTP